MSASVVTEVPLPTMSTSRFSPQASSERQEDGQAVPVVGFHLSPSDMVMRSFSAPNMDDDSRSIFTVDSTKSLVLTLPCAVEDNEEFLGIQDCDMQSRMSKASSKRSVQDLECAICFEEVDEVRKLPCACNISYCKGCWAHSLEASFGACGEARCPTCRSSVHVDFDEETGELTFHDELSTEEQVKDKYLKSKIIPAQIKRLRCYGKTRPPVRGSIFTKAKCAFVNSMVGHSSLSPSEEGALSAPRCVCNGVLERMTGIDRYMKYARTLAPHLPHDSPEFAEFARETISKAQTRDNSRITCDICSTDILPSKRAVTWTCEKGRDSMLHGRGYDICDCCFNKHAKRPPPRRASIG